MRECGQFKCLVLAGQVPEGRGGRARAEGMSFEVSHSYFAKCFDFLFISIPCNDATISMTGNL